MARKALRATERKKLHAVAACIDITNLAEGVRPPFTNHGKVVKAVNFLQKMEGPSLIIEAERCVAVKGAEEGSQLGNKRTATGTEIHWYRY